MLHDRLQKKRRCKYFWAATLIVCIGWAFPSALSAEPDRSLKIKAVFLFKFLDYVTWPPGQQQGVCTLGGNPFGSLLEYIDTHSSVVRGIKVAASVGDVRSCHIVYVSGGGVPALAGSPVLTVSERDGFAREGGMIEMREEEGKIKLLINRPILEASGLKASSRLLDLAEVVQ